MNPISIETESLDYERESESLVDECIFPGVDINKILNEGFCTPIGVSEASTQQIKAEFDTSCFNLNEAFTQKVEVKN